MRNTKLPSTLEAREAVFLDRVKNDTTENIFADHKFTSDFMKFAEEALSGMSYEERTSYVEEKFPNVVIPNCAWIKLDCIIFFIFIHFPRK